MNSSYWSTSVTPGHTGNYSKVFLFVFLGVISKHYTFLGCNFICFLICILRCNYCFFLTVHTCGNWLWTKFQKAIEWLIFKSMHHQIGCVPKDRQLQIGIWKFWVRLGLSQKQTVINDQFELASHKMWRVACYLNLRYFGQSKAVNIRWFYDVPLINPCDVTVWIPTESFHVRIYFLMPGLWDRRMGIKLKCTKNA